jgi:hypothetical protein
LNALLTRERLEVAAFEEVLRGNNLVPVGVGLDQGVGQGIGDGAAGVQIVVLQLGLIELIILEALAESVDIVQVDLESGTPGIFRGVAWLAAIRALLPAAQLRAWSAPNTLPTTWSFIV